MSSGDGWRVGGHIIFYRSIYRTTNPPLRPGGQQNMLVTPSPVPKKASASTPTAAGTTAKKPAKAAAGVSNMSQPPSAGVKEPEPLLYTRDDRFSASAPYPINASRAATSAPLPPW